MHQSSKLLLNKSISFFAVFLFASIVTAAQQGFYVPKQGNVFFNSDTATIFSNVINEGNLGVEKKAVINFKGQQWQNSASAQMTDATSGGTTTNGIGGWIRFNADSLRQKLDGGYNTVLKTGPVFSNLQIQNPFGVELTGSSVKVWQEVNFNKGLLYLNNQLFTVGHKFPGKISGYDSLHFFVTDRKQGTGILVRENISAANGLVVFPVGTNDTAYTPAAVQSRSGRGDDYYVSVFDSVKSNLFNGNSLAQQSVGKTWQIGKRYYQNQDEVALVLQHLNADEGAYFAANRNRSYIAQYQNNKWDEAYPLGTPVNGYLTPGQPLKNSSANSRTLTATLSGTSYFTKLIGTIDTLNTNLLLGAYRAGAFINRVIWQTKPEKNIQTYVVERRRANEANFYPIDTVASQAINGYSINYLNYSINDNNPYNGITFYRLKIYEYGGSFHYSYVVAISGAAFIEVKLWPNPTPDKFTIILSGNIAKQLVIYNSIGQLMWKQDVNGRYVMDVQGHGLIPGMYHVVALDEKGAVLGSEKLMIMK